jgi:ureidoglycolate hydrolase
MSNPYVVQVEPLTVESFAPYGQAILVPTTPAPKTGDDWDCWFGVGDLSCTNPKVGIVITRPASGRVDAMEREPVAEFLLPITGPIIQAVGLPGDLSDFTQVPDAHTVRAFRIEPGQAIAMAPGTWHCAAMPVGGETLYYFATEEHPPEPGRGSSPWIPFADGNIVQVQK